MNQKLIKMFGGFIAGFIVFIIIIFLISSCAGRKKDYSDYENQMIKAAKNYYKTNEKKLPDEDQESKKITLKSLVNDNYIEEASKYFDNENISCDGSVTVTNNNSYYQYIPQLNCKNGNDKYKTTSLSDKITEETVTSGVGLYEVGNEYIFKGDNVNNYLVFDGQLYRIIKVNDDSSIRLIKVEGLSQMVWDNIYNPDYKYASGLNEFTHDSLNSTIKDELDNYYNNIITDTNYKHRWDDVDRSFIKAQTLCVGKRSKEDITKDSSTECSVKYENQIFGLLNTYEYLAASLDPNCSYTVDSNCKNYNWLSTAFTNKTIWTITASSEDTKSIYVLQGSLTTKTASSYAKINVVFNIDGNIPYLSGTGTESDPYIVGYDMKKK